MFNGRVFHNSKKLHEMDECKICNHTRFEHKGKSTQLGRNEGECLHKDGCVQFEG